MYTVVGSPKTRAFRVVWAMEELGLEYDLVSEPPRGETASALNPTGKIPCLKVGHATIIDSVAILQYLADKHGALTYEAGTLERAEQDSFTQFICDEIDGALWTAARNDFVNPEEKRVAAIKDVLVWEMERSVKALEQRLGDREFLMGDRFTVPDILLTHCAGWMRGTGFPLESDTLRAYVRRNIEREAYKKASAVRKPS
ncbi:glutathione S-transferase family protein [Neptunicoccus cionae]|uniref:Glutathione S-transferase n=1 Tax=Neptunicoccus cionae TaxID=2035344 RepID=A0A916R102_9RHOB|nr:glutathione S-transferase family protein [Amylibacter cionae]GGA19702.1 glutathione S-transferase [Amylibacter cionae]